MTTPDRLKRHRARAASKGVRRIEVAVNAGDAPIIRRAAEILRGRGEAADALRRVVREAGEPGPSALAVLEDLRRHAPEGPGLDLSRNDLAPDRDFSF
jgi:hypothetical protein